MALTKAHNRMIEGAAVNVKDFGAVGDGVTDDTAAIQAAVTYIESLGDFDIGTDDWAYSNKQTLFFPKGTYLVSAPIAYPVGLTPNFVNYNLYGEGAVIKASGSYSGGSLIRMKAAFHYTIEGLGFDGFTTDYVIFNDSSLTNNYGGRTIYKNLIFSNCEYCIRHEIESVVAVFDGCQTDENAIKFLRVWRADQVIIRDCFFNWSQLSKSNFDSFIEFGKDELTPTGEAAYPGGGTYNIARLAVENCMFIPTGSPLAVQTAWIEMVSGSLNVRDCHFGPESTNRPITVLSKVVGARFQNVADQADSTINVENSSCATSYAVVYCYDNYPNYINLKNIRLNILDYSGIGTQRYLISGDATTLNALSATYTETLSQFFRFSVEGGIPQYANLVAIDPDLDFPKLISVYPEISTGASEIASTLMRFDLHDRDFLSPSFAHDAGLYEVTVTGEIFSTPAGSITYKTTYKGLIEIGEENGSLIIGYTELYTSGVTGLGATPTISAVFLNGGTNGESTTETIAALDAGNFCIRIKGITNLAGNNWQSGRLRIRKIV